MHLDLFTMTWHMDETETYCTFLSNNNADCYYCPEEMKNAKKKPSIVPFVLSEDMKWPDALTGRETTPGKCFSEHLRCTQTLQIPQTQWKLVPRTYHSVFACDARRLGWRVSAIWSQLGSCCVKWIPASAYLIKQKTETKWRIKKRKAKQLVTHLM